jgi:peptidoglycan hydrolase CwlO-like protein
MKKIEDIKPKSLDLFNIKRKNNYSYFLNAKSLKIIFLILLFIGINFAFAPLSFTQIAQKTLPPELEAKKRSLEAQLQEVLKEIENYKKEISKIRNQKRSIQQEINLVNSQIKKTELEIQAINLQIKNLNKKIEETKKSINLTEEKIKKSKNYLLVLVRYYYQLKQRSIVEVFLAEARLSDYFSQFYYLQKVQESINNELDNLKELNEILNKQKTKLENQLEEQNNLLMLSKIKYQELQDLKEEKNKLLAQAQKLEREYSRKLEESERTAAEIRKEIYRLAGGAGPITFGEAYEYAKIVEKYTGVRPAFLLAVLHYESKLGQNVGTCHYKDAMKPSERPIFEEIVKELGLDPNKMPVSCKPWYGWGGAMGPAQFLPSTWMKYKERISKITGNNPPSPWNILDSFVAAGLYLKDAGADAKTYSAEWKAAMIYFAGSNWNNPSLRFYGDDVMSIAQRFEEDIKILERSK